MSCSLLRTAFRPTACWLALAICLLVITRVSAQVVINEVHYDPVDKTVPEEFIELYNAGDTPVDLSGWHFTDDSQRSTIALCGTACDALRVTGHLETSLCAEDGDVLPIP